MALYHSAKGSVNYEIVGNPTITDGILTASTENDHIQTSTIYTIQANDTLEFATRLKVNYQFEPTNATQAVTYGLAAQNEWYPIYIWIDSWAGHCCRITGAYKDGFGLSVRFTEAQPLSASDWFSVKAVIHCAISTVDFYYQINDSGWVFKDTKTVTNGYVWAGKNIYVVASNANDSGVAFNAIDLNNTYLKINGQPWFGVCPVEVKKVVRQVGGYPAEVSGVDSLSLPKAQSNSLTEVKLSGGCEQNGTPTPNAPIDIICNNGVLKVSPQGQIYTDGTVETVAVNTTGDTATAEMLLKVGDYKDEQSVLNGSVTRNIGIKVFDGSEDWYLSNSNVVIRGATETWGAIAGVGGYCTHLKVLISGESIFAGSCRFASDFNIYYYQTAFGVNSVEQFKNFLADQYANGTPVIIVYPLATSTTETVTAQPMNVHTGNNTLSVTQASMSDLGLSAKYNKLRDVNYVVKDDKLVFADQGLYLTGPKNYEVAGSPTIEDGLLLMPDASNRLFVHGMDLLDNPFEIGSKIKLNTISDNTYGNYGDGSYFLPFYVRPNAIDFMFRQSSSDEWNVARISQTSVVDTWYWWKVIHDGNGLYTFKISTDNSNWTTATTQLSGPLNIPHSSFAIGVASNHIPPKAIDLNETYINIDGQLWFYGKNYASKNIAPVPGSYTFGNTTTPYIGYVDMRTQQYHQAPAGTAIVSPDGKATYDDYVIEDGKLVAVNPNIYIRNSSNKNDITISDVINTHYTYDLKFRYNQGYPTGYSENICPIGRWVSSGTDYQFGVEYALPNTSSRQISDLQSYKFPTVGNSYLPDPYGPIELKVTISNGYKSVLCKNGSSIREATSSSQAPNNSVSGYGLWTKWGDYRGSGDIYYIKLFNENGTLVRHLVPVPEGMVIGNITVDTNRLFDIVTQTLFGNVNGSFTIGRDE